MGLRRRIRVARDCHGCLLDRKIGQINRTQIYPLLRLEIDDPRRQQGMKAMRVVGSKTYVRSYFREAVDGAWQAITVDLAKA
jgi:Arc/MetJ family transcription regulator